MVVWFDKKSKASFHVEEGVVGYEVETSRRLLC